MDLNSSLTSAMGTLVSASVFSVGFVTARVQGSLDRATARAKQIDDRFRDGSVPISKHWLDEEYDALAAGLQAEYPRFLVRAIWVFGALVYALAGIAGADAGIGSLPKAATLAALLVAETVVLAIGTSDQRRARSVLAGRLGATLSRRMSRAIEAVNLTNPDAVAGFGSRLDSEQRKKLLLEPRKTWLKDAESAAQSLVESTGGQWRDAQALAALVKAAQGYDPETRRWETTAKDLDALIREFRRLAQENPVRPDLWRTCARLAESAERWDVAANAWLKSKPSAFGLRMLDEPFVLEPINPRTFAYILGRLEADGRLNSDPAEEAFRALVDATADSDTFAESELPPAVKDLMRRITVAKIGRDWPDAMHAASWLGSARPLSKPWPAFDEEARRLQDELVAPAVHEQEKQIMPWL